MTLNPLKTPAYPDGRALVIVVAFAFALIAARFYIVPSELEQTAVGGVLSGSADDVWNGLYAIGGPAVVIGMLAGLRHLDALGCNLIGLACLVQGASIGVLRGWPGAFTVVLYTLLAIYFCSRALAIYRWART